MATTSSNRRYQWRQDSQVNHIGSFKGTYTRPAWSVPVGISHKDHHHQQQQQPQSENITPTTNPAAKPRKGKQVHAIKRRTKPMHKDTGRLYSAKHSVDFTVTRSLHRTYLLGRRRYKNHVVLNSNVSYADKMSSYALYQRARRYPFVALVQKWMVQPSDGGRPTPQISGLMYAPEGSGNEVDEMIEQQHILKTNPRGLELDDDLGTSRKPVHKESDLVFNITNDASWDEFYKQTTNSKWLREHHPILDISVNQIIAPRFENPRPDLKEVFDIHSVRESVQSGHIYQHARFAAARFQLPSNDMLEAIMLATSEFYSRPEHQHMIGLFTTSTLLTFGILLQEHLRDQIPSAKDAPRRCGASKSQMRDVSSIRTYNDNYYIEFTSSDFDSDSAN
ncbi:hypothetical protein BASA61_001124 [Batrachochytrium salamandrivorans]|nr:hypothetical protein BASA62_008760 [Batrachochytrium salamandrivorans]KAH6602412.1 hypothetical protein BASA61_001124 [Batrachochytrium salamandrivorans]KAH9268171.1 hypothetical protein BASA84_000366 [Batrachochytrium salamandrivorans]